MSRVPELDFLEPQLATLVDQPPEGDEWIHEIKHDGYRTMLVRDRHGCRAFTRNGFDWSERYSRIVNAAKGLPCKSAIIDGEIIVQDSRGASDFESLKAAIRWHPERLIFYAFDLLDLDAEDLRDVPLIDRRAKLRSLIAPDAHSPLQFSEAYDEGGAALFRACAELGLEGVVSKLTTSPYRSGRSKTWLKTKCFTESTFVIIGTDKDRKTGAKRALLARPHGQGLVYAGAAFIALPGEQREALHNELERLTAEQCPLGFRMPGARWVKPKIVARVRHLAASKYLRHATVREIQN
jgi:bifunctional non-homologous end joining protein LigD